MLDRKSTQSHDVILHDIEFRFPPSHIAAVAFHNSILLSQGVQNISKRRPQLPPWMLQCIPSESFSISWSSGFAAGSVHADALYSGRCSKRCITAFVSVWYEQLFRTYTSVAKRMRNTKVHGYHRRWTLACAQNLDRTTYATDYTFLTRAIACRSIR